MNQLYIPRKGADMLLKGVFESYFEDFLHFMYPDADTLFNFKRKIQFLDKELAVITPDRSRKGGKRIADLLAKVPLIGGGYT